MSDRSVQEELADFIEHIQTFWESERDEHIQPLADFTAIGLLASAVMRRIRAEAWDDGFDAHDQDWKHHDANNWGDEDCIDATYNPYRDEEPNV